MPMLHGATLAKVEEIWGSWIIDKTIIVLTKSDTASDVFQKQAEAHGRPTSETRRRGSDLFWEDVEMWKTELREDQGDGFGRCQVCVTGRVDFTAPGPGQAAPESLTFVGGKKTWHFKVSDAISTVSLPTASVFRVAFHHARETYPNFNKSFLEEFGRDEVNVGARLVFAAAVAAVGVFTYFTLDPEKSKSRPYFMLSSFAGTCYLIYPLAQKAYKRFTTTGAPQYGLP